MSHRSRLTWVCLVLALLCGGCASIRTSNPQVNLVVQSINERELREYSDALAAIGSRPANNQPKTDLTVQFITTTLQQAGYRDIITNSAFSEGGKAFNIIAEIKGTRHPDCVVEVGAHYDTVPFSPGADDNGSGAAGVLTLARALSIAQCAKTIRFVFYCQEETHIAGSLAHVRNVITNKDEHLEGAIVMEMIGYSVDGPSTQCVPIRIPFVFWPSTTGNSIVAVGNSQSAFVGRLYERAAQRHAPDLEVYSLKYLGGFLKDAARSDHSSYWACNVPAIMLTDTANFRNTNYHKPSDQVSTLNFSFMTKVTRAAAAALLEWAEFEPAAPASTLTFYREPCKQVARPLEIDNPAKGLSLHDLSRESACREIVTRYWDAVRTGNEEMAAKLWCAWPNGGHPRLIKENRLVEVGKPYQQKGCFDSIPNLITPIRVQLADGRIVDENLIVIFRDVGLEESCLIIGVYNR